LTRGSRKPYFSRFPRKHACWTQPIQVRLRAPVKPHERTRADAICPARAGGLRGEVFPRLSETFILNEVLELEEQGFALHIFSLNRPAEAVSHAQTRLVRSPITYLPAKMEHAPLRLLQGSSTSGQNILERGGTGFAMGCAPCSSRGRGRAAGVRPGVLPHSGVGRDPSLARPFRQRPRQGRLIVHRITGTPTASRRTPKTSSMASLSPRPSCRSACAARASSSPTAGSAQSTSAPDSTARAARAKSTRFTTAWTRRFPTAEKPAGGTLILSVGGWWRKRASSTSSRPASS